MAKCGFLAGLWIGSIAAWGVLAQPARAQNNVEWSVEVRYRGENDRRVFEADLGTLSYDLLRTRIIGTFSPSASTHAVVKMQDARTFGVPESGVDKGDNNLGVHEAYFEIGEFFSRHVMLRMGRFELNYGNERLFGGSEWSNTGRTFDASRYSLVWPTWQLDFIGASLVSYLERGNKSHTVLGGVYLRLVKIGADVFAVVDNDSRLLLLPDQRQGLGRITLGVYSSRRLGQSFDHTFNGAFQFGHIGDKDIAAFLFALEMGYTFPVKSQYRAALGIDYVSGDNNPHDDDYRAFNNLYYSWHKFRGYMDLFLASNPEGLIDLNFRQGMNPTKDWALAGDVHLFHTAAYYPSAKDGRNTRGRGVELDGLIRTTKLQKAVLEAGASVFFPSEDWQGVNAEPAYWVYTTVTVNLP